MKEKDISDFIEEAKDYSPSEEEMIIIGDFADEYKDRSEEDIFVEIIRMNNEMEDEMSSDEYEAIFEKLKAMRPLLNEEQAQKLDKVLEYLDKGI